MGPRARVFAALLAVLGFGVLAGTASAATVSFNVMSGNGSVGGTDSQITYNDSSQSPTTGPAFIVAPNPAWAGPIAGTQWVSSAASTDSGSNPSFQMSF